MKILIVGGNSSVAQVLRPVLASFAEVLTAGKNGCNVELDLSWPVERFNLPSGLDAVINMAAHFGGKDFEMMLESEEVNVLGALKLSHACVHAGVGHMVQISSIFASLDEDSPFYNSYAMSKRHAEDLVHLYCQSTGLSLAILRLSQIYGVGEVFRRHQPLLYSIIDRAERGDDIVFYGNRDAQRNFIHVEDSAEIIARVLSRHIEGRYVCASLSNVRLSEIASAAVTAFGSSSRVNFDVEKPDILDRVFEIDDLLYQKIDYYPRISLTQGMTMEADHRKSLL
jgi:nucleoside-diphosphate-sugar epimerase